MENCVAPGSDEFDILLEVVLSLVRVPGDNTILFHWLYRRAVLEWKV